jgi:nucleoid-associated protein YgaU
MCGTVLTRPGGECTVRSSNPPGCAMTEDMPDFSNVQSGSSSTATKLYVVVSGDSLSKIAKREYGDANEWKRIYEANRDLLKDPDKIFPGQKLKIPAL